MEWLEENRTLVIDIPVRVSLFVAGVVFLHSLGADSAVAIGGLVGLALKGSLKKPATSSKPKRSRNR
jgi:hypothetical protein